MNSSVDDEIQSLYQSLLDAWNRRSADDMADLFSADGNVVGFDGSQVNGRAQIASELGQIFSQHQTPPFVSVVREVRSLTPDVALLRAVVGMVPPGQTELNPALNAVQSLVAVKQEGRWRIALFQNTPAAFHGRPELSQSLTEELRQASRLNR